MRLRPGQHGRLSGAAKGRERPGSRETTFWKSENNTKTAIIGRNAHSIAYDLKVEHNIWCIPS